ncbi:MAG: cell division protein FtsL [Thiotrichales bacterium]|nr:MAG: cell division protein FtsL [Thiotrichales bacterium]
MSVKNSANANIDNKPLTVDSVTNWQLPLLVVLFVSVVFLAIKIVVQRHESRTAYVKLQALEKERDKLAAQWSRLKLEQGTALNQVRVERYARWDLGMRIPKTSQIKLVREPQVGNVILDQAEMNHDELSKANLSE